MARLEAAAALWPLDFHIRLRPAVFCSEQRWTGSAKPCMAVLRRELAINPNSVDLRRNLAGFLIEQGDMDGARAEVERIGHLIRGGNLVIPVNVNPATR